MREAEINKSESIVLGKKIELTCTKGLYTKYYKKRNDIVLV